MEEREIRRLARLSAIRLGDDEVKRLGGDLARLLEYVGQLKSLETGPPEAASGPDAANRLREDEVTPSFPLEKALANAPGREGDFFRVPPVIKARKAKNG